jgi:ubiquinone/menaquinone biosynthesis C-methylase UbiE
LIQNNTRKHNVRAIIGVAAAWHKCCKTIDRATEAVSRRLVELAEIKPGFKVLDIATGIGEPALTAAKQVGRSGHVLATDISPQILSFAKQIAISFGLQDVIEFKGGMQKQFTYHA